MSKDNWTEINRKYACKNIMAPMVRTGTLPMRLLALDFGADLVYSEELIDFKLLRTKRLVNSVLGTVDYIDQSDGTVVFRTCQREKQKVILQIGTCDPGRALAVAKLIENDVAGIDINMGCPKEFSIKGGMGAALLSLPEKAVFILKGLVDNISIPVTCKVRVLDTVEETIHLCQQLAATGIAAIAVHGRKRDERPQHSNRNGFLKAVAEALHIPVIANGGSKDIEKFKDIAAFRTATGCASVMVARAAQGNCSIFRREGLLPLDVIITRYLRYCVEYDNQPANTKYNIQNILKELQETPKGKMFLEAQTLEQMCSLWNLGEFCQCKQKQLRSQGLLTRRDVTPPSLSTHQIKKAKLDSDKVMYLSCAFLRGCFQSDIELPKTQLLMWCRKQKLDQPKYRTLQQDKLFQSVVCVGDKQYSSTYWEKNKKRAEQGAAIVGLVDLGVLDRDYLKEAGCLV